MPALTEMTKAYGRLRSASARRGTSRRSLREGTDVLAVFDLEGTVLDSTVIHQYLQLRRRTLHPTKWPAEVADLVSSAPTYLKAEKRDRGEFIRAFMRRYQGVTAGTVREQVAGPLGQDMRRLLRPGALARIEEHRAAGHRTVLVTGSIDLLVEPIAHLFDEVVAGRMDERDGVMTGYLATPPLVDEARAQWLKTYAEQGGYDLSRSYGYGDSHADASWLLLVGHPHTVNPDLPLYRLAKQNHWPIEDWKTA
jgi:alcohol-forming fatty acyl-CoA reductase